MAAFPKELLWHASIKTEALLNESDKHGTIPLLERLTIRSCSRTTDAGYKVHIYTYIKYIDIHRDILLTYRAVDSSSEI